MKLKKIVKIFIVITIILSFVACSNNKQPQQVQSNYSSSSQQQIYVGSSNSDKYHLPNCEWAQKIKSQNLIKFSSEDDAQDNGYVSCKVCTP